MGEEAKELAIIPESVLSRSKRREQWALMKAEELKILKLNNA